MKGRSHHGTTEQTQQLYPFPECEPNGSCSCSGGLGLFAAHFRTCSQTLARPRQCRAIRICGETVSDTLGSREILEPVVNKSFKTRSGARSEQLVASLCCWSYQLGY